MLINIILLFPTTPGFENVKTVQNHYISRPNPSPVEIVKVKYVCNRARFPGAIPVPPETPTNIIRILLEKQFNIQISKLPLFVSK